ncbi:anthranilate synthase component I family protein [Microbacterium hominis]|uniref:Metal ABC transporter ATP-binding protein n=1 Tax=Microbacterium hominis TaxID=162426 RepID=A0A0B4CL83_9MICO|nr:anthranilate synthase component I family protein [Microbacterium hominis]KIC57222.1 metal ABC transporter ATP-binding protein [Microbacterium hominis]
MTTRLVARRHDWVDPAVVFEAILSGEEHAFWLDAGPGATTGFSWLGTGAPGVGPRDVALVPDVRPAAVVPGPFQGGWVGWSGFDDAAAAAGAPGRADPADGPQELWLRIEWFVVFDHAAHEVWIAAPTDRGEALASAVDGAATAAPRTATPRGCAAHRPLPVASARQTPEEYRALIARCRDAIRAGDAYQLCLTTRFTVAASAPFDPTSTYLTLREALPAHHGGIIRSGTTALLSASPERFLDVADGLVRTRPIKGTRPRGRDADEDAALRRELVDSVKERAENVMIVDLMRNDLQRVCRPGTVRAERLLEVESYAAVHQLVSTVAGRLRPDATLGQLLDAAFPAGSMTGAPKLSAMTILSALEGRGRGIYAGCFGWVGTDGHADLAMTIRSIVLRPDRAYVGAGGGITWLSDPDEEVAEVGLKARGPLAALGADLPPGW